MDVGALIGVRIKGRVSLAGTREKNLHISQKASPR
jgi:hypothetical protein